MPDKLTRIAINAQIWKTDTVERMRGRLADEEGQTAAEYLGIILIVAVIIAAIVTTGIAGDIASRIDELITDIGGGDAPEGGPAPEGSG